MSLPKIPEMHNIPCITPSAAISFILASIALEEIGLSHIINAEGEKIQAVVEKFKCNNNLNICDVLAVDKSVNDVLRTILKKEILLELKMTEALEALPHCQPSIPCPPNPCPPNPCPPCPCPPNPCPPCHSTY